MKKIIFILGCLLLIISIIEPVSWSIKTNTLIIFILLIFLVHFDDIQEWDLLKGIFKGKKVDKELRQLSEQIKIDEHSTQPDEDDLTKLRNKKINLMTVDRSNFLALVFEIERLLRYVAIQFYPTEVNNQTSLKKIIELLKKKEYLTESGVNNLKAISDVRNLIVHGEVSQEEDSKLNEWTELAYNLYIEINNSINGQTSVAKS